VQHLSVVPLFFVRDVRADHNAVVADDVIAGHTNAAPDFRREGANFVHEIGFRLARAVFGQKHDVLGDISLPGSAIAGGNGVHQLLRLTFQQCADIRRGLRDRLCGNDLKSAADCDAHREQLATTEHV
jgi:hypothetical protein